MNKTITIPQRNHKNSDPKLFSGIISFNDFDTNFHNEAQSINRIINAEKFDRACCRNCKTNNNYKMNNRKKETENA